MTNLHIVLAIAVAALFSPLPAMAYIGPGVGAGALAAVVGVVGAIFLALFAILYYPVKRMLKKRKANAKVTTDSSTDE